MNRSKFTTGSNHKEEDMQPYGSHTTTHKHVKTHRTTCTRDEQRSELLDLEGVVEA
jgi:hypothetical protein